MLNVNPLVGGKTWDRFLETASVDELSKAKGLMEYAQQKLPKTEEGRRLYGLLARRIKQVGEQAMLHAQAAFA